MPNHITLTDSLGNTYVVVLADNELIAYSENAFPDGSRLEVRRVRKFPDPCYCDNAETCNCEK